MSSLPDLRVHLPEIGNGNFDFQNDNEECVERRQQIPPRLNEMLVRL